MKITNGSLKLSTIFDLDEEDIFLYEGNYYIAGRIDYCNHRRECYNLTLNLTRTFTVNFECYGWNSENCELIIR